MPSLKREDSSRYESQSPALVPQKATETYLPLYSSFNSKGNAKFGISKSKRMNFLPKADESQIKDPLGLAPTSKITYYKYNEPRKENKMIKMISRRQNHFLKDVYEYDDMLLKEREQK